MMLSHLVSLGTVFGDVQSFSIFGGQCLVMFSQLVSLGTVFGDVQSFSIFRDSVW